MASPATSDTGIKPVGARNRGSDRRSSWWLRLLVAVIALVFSAPVLFLLLEIANVSEGIGQIVGSSEWVVPLLNSLGLAGAVTLASMVIGGGLAILISRTDLPGQRVWRLLLALPLVIPSFVGATALIAATGPGSLLPFVPRLEGFVGSLVVLTLFT